MFVDAGWFLNIPVYANRSDGMTFEKCAKALIGPYNALFDRYKPPRSVLLKVRQYMSNSM